MNLKKEVREEELFVNVEEEEKYQVLSVYPTRLVVEKRVGGAEFLHSPCLALRRNLNLTSDDMYDIQRQGISSDDENEPAPKNIPDEVPQPEYSYIWK